MALHHNKITLFAKKYMTFTKFFLGIFLVGHANGLLLIFYRIFYKSKAL